MIAHRREIAGISGWNIIALLMERAPDWVMETAGKCESPIEQLFVCAIGLIILSLPEDERPTMDVQVPIGRFRADIVLVARLGAPRIVVECDGAEFHKNIKRDVTRTSVIERHGYRVLRVTGSEIHNNPLARAKWLMQEAGFLKFARESQ